MVVFASSLESLSPLFLLVLVWIFAVVILFDPNIEKHFFTQTKQTKQQVG
jgi:hypothetical protein